MERITGLFRNQFVSPSAHHNIRRFDADHQIVVAKLFNNVHLVKGAFYQTFCGNTVIFLHQFFLKRTAVYPNTDGNIPLLRHIYNCLDTLCASNISGIDTDLVGTVLHGRNRKTIIKMNICYQRNVNLFFDLFQSLCRFHGRHCTADNVAASSLQGKDLLYGCLHILCFCIGHRLDQDGISASNLLISYLNYFGMVSVHTKFLHIL